MKNIARIVVAATAIVSMAGMAAAPATAAPKDAQQRNIWCC